MKKILVKGVIGIIALLILSSISAFFPAEVIDIEDATNKLDTTIQKEKKTEYLVPFLMEEGSVTLPEGEGYVSGKIFDEDFKMDSEVKLRTSSEIIGIKKDLSIIVSDQFIYVLKYTKVENYYHIKTLINEDDGERIQEYNIEATIIDGDDVYFAISLQTRQWNSRWGIYFFKLADLEITFLKKVIRAEATDMSQLNIEVYDGKFFFVDYEYSIYQSFSYIRMDYYDPIADELDRKVFNNIQIRDLSIEGITDTRIEKLFINSGFLYALLKTANTTNNFGYVLVNMDTRNYISFNTNFLPSLEKDRTLGVFSILYDIVFLPLLAINSDNNQFMEGIYISSEREEEFTISYSDLELGQNLSTLAYDAKQGYKAIYLTIATESEIIATRIKASFALQMLDQLQSDPIKFSILGVTGLYTVIMISVMIMRYRRIKSSTAELYPNDKLNPKDEV